MLLTFLDPSNFKSYDELKAKLVKVLSEDSFLAKTAKKAETMEAYEDSEPSFKAKSPPKFDTSSDDDDDESLEFFKSLAS